jgi:hypothetical protein
LPTSKEGAALKELSGYLATSVQGASKSYETRLAVSVQGEGMMSGQVQRCAAVPYGRPASFEHASCSCAVSTHTLLQARQSCGVAAVPGTMCGAQKGDPAMSY